MAFFDVLLRVVPGAAGVGHEDRQQNAGDERSGQQAAEGFRTEQNAHQQRNHNGHDARNDHLMESRGGGNTDAGCVVGLRGAFENAGNLTELTANLFDHLVGRFGDRVHRHGGEGEGKHAADQKTDDHIGGENIDADGFKIDLVGVGDKQRESCERGGADGKTLAHGGRGVADGVEFIRDLTHMGIQAAHLGDTAGVVGDGPVGVHRDRDAGGGQHADGGQSDTVEIIGNTIGDIDPDADQDDGHPGAHHADRDAADDGGGGAGFGLIRNALDGFIIAGGVDFGHIADDETDDNTRDNRQRVEGPAEEFHAERNGNDRDDRGGDIGAHLQRGMGISVILAADKEGRDNGSGDSYGGDQQGIEGPGTREGAVDQNAEGQRRDQRTHIALEEVSAHAGHVAYVIANVIRDDGGIAGVVLRDAGFHLADQVGADVSGLGIDTAADTGKQRDGGGAERETEKNIIVAGQNVDQAAAEKTEADHAHAHDRTAREGDGERLIHARFHGGVGRADIGPGGDLHPEEPGQDGTESAEQEAERGSPVNKEADQNKQNRDKNRENSVFGHEKRVRAFRDRGSDLLHPGSPRRGFGDETRLIGGKAKRADGEDRNDPYKTTHTSIAPVIKE